MSEWHDAFTDAALLLPSTLDTRSITTVWTKAVRVRFRERMAAQTGVLGGIHGHDRLPAQDVRPRRDCFQVGRIDARSIAAEVIEFESIWDRPMYPCVTDPMGGG